MARYKKGDEPVPGYRLVRFLGRGNFGEVWHATMLAGGIDAALKFNDLKDRGGFKEFRALQLVKRIRHPNLVPINAFWLKGEDGSLLDDAAGESVDPTALWKQTAPPSARGKGAAAPRPVELIIAMGLGDKSLGDYLKDCKGRGLRGIPPEELLDYMEGAARAIDYLNKGTPDFRGIQHCDIKPHNIMIVANAAQVCDFGLARIADDLRTTTAAASPAYAAPEYLQEQGRPSHATDQYSLAVAYHELRTGELPFKELSVMAVMMAHIQGKLDLHRLDPAEREVIKKATERDPNLRFPDCMKMVRALRRAYESGQENLPRHAPKEIRGRVFVPTEGMEVVPGTGYRLQRRLMSRGDEEVWEAIAPGGAPAAILIRDLETSTAEVDHDALFLVARMDHPNLRTPQGVWFLDRYGQDLNIEALRRPHGPRPARLVIAGRLAQRTLHDRLEECLREGLRGIPADELRLYMEQAAAALDHMNAAEHGLASARVGVQHLNLRPGNFLLHGPVLQLGNFSRARVLAGEAGVLREPVASYDLAYAPPETLRGQITSRTDQFALAVVYVQLRTGRLPVDSAASSEQLLSDRRMGKLDLSDLSDSEGAVIARATSLDPMQRFSSARHFVDELKVALERSKLFESENTIHCQADATTHTDSPADSSVAVEAPSEIESVEDVALSTQKTQWVDSRVSDTKGDLPSAAPPAAVPDERPGAPSPIESAPVSPPVAPPSAVVESAPVLAHLAESPSAGHGPAGSTPVHLASSLPLVEPPAPVGGTAFVNQPSARSTPLPHAPDPSREFNRPAPARTREHDPRPPAPGPKSPSPPAPPADKSVPDAPPSTSSSPIGGTALIDKSPPQVERRPARETSPRPDDRLSPPTPSDRTPEPVEEPAPARPSRPPSRRTGRRFLAALVLLGGITAVGTFYVLAIRPDARDVAKEVREKIQSRDYAGALELVRDPAAASSSVPPAELESEVVAAWRKAVESQLNEARFAEATKTLAELRLATRSSPDDLDAAVLTAWLEDVRKHAESGDPSGASEQFARLESAWPGASGLNELRARIVSAYRESVQAALGRGDVEEAYETYAKLEDAFPNDASISDSAGLIVAHQTAAAEKLVAGEEYRKAAVLCLDMVNRLHDPAAEEATREVLNACRAAAKAKSDSGMPAEADRIRLDVVAVFPAEASGWPIRATISTPTPLDKVHEALAGMADDPAASLAILPDPKAIPDQKAVRWIQLAQARIKSRLPEPVWPEVAEHLQQSVPPAGGPQEDAATRAQRLALGLLADEASGGIDLDRFVPTLLDVLGIIVQPEAGDWAFDAWEIDRLTALKDRVVTAALNAAIGAQVPADGLALVEKALSLAGAESFEPNRVKAQLLIRSGDFRTLDGVLLSLEKSAPADRKQEIADLKNQSKILNPAVPAAERLAAVASLDKRIQTLPPASRWELVQTLADFLDRPAATLQPALETLTRWSTDLPPAEPARQKAVRTVMDRLWDRRAKELLAGGQPLGKAVLAELDPVTMGGPWMALVRVEARLNAAASPTPQEVGNLAKQAADVKTTDHEDAASLTLYRMLLLFDVVGRAMNVSADLDPGQVDDLASALKACRFPTPLGAPREQRVAARLIRGADLLHTGVSLRVLLESGPYPVKQDAQRAYEWLDACPKPLVEGLTDKSAYWLNLALSAWFDPDRTPQQTSAAAEAARMWLASAKDDDPARPALLLVSALCCPPGAIAEREQSALKAASDLLALIRREPAASAVPVATIRERLVIPTLSRFDNVDALDLVPPAPVPGERPRLPSTSELRQPLADLYADYGRIAQSAGDAYRQECALSFRRALDLESRPALVGQYGYAWFEASTPEWADDLREANPTGRLALVAARKKDLDLLETTVRTAVKSDASEPKAHALLGVILKEKVDLTPGSLPKDYDPALTALTQAVEIMGAPTTADRKGDLADFLLARADARVHRANAARDGRSAADAVKREMQADLLAALEDGRKASTLGSRRPFDSRLAVAHALEDLAWLVGAPLEDDGARYGDAVKAFEEAIGLIRAAQPIDRERLALAYRDLGRAQYRWAADRRDAPANLTAAHNALTDATRNDDTLADAHFWMGRVKYAQKDYLSAGLEFEAASNLDVGNPEMRFWRAVAFNATDNPDDADEWFRMARAGVAQLDPPRSTEYLLTWTFLVYRKALSGGRIKEERPRLDPLAEEIRTLRNGGKLGGTPSDRRMAATVLGDLRAADGKWEEAIKEYDYRLEDGSPRTREDADLLYARAVAVATFESTTDLKKGLDSQILADAEQAAELSKGWDNAIRAKALAMAGDARIWIADNLTSLPDAAAVRDAGEGQLSEALKLSPNDANAARWRTRLENSRKK
jgi:serine/threonine protein kinase